MLDKINLQIEYFENSLEAKNQNLHFFNFDYDEYKEYIKPERHELNILDNQRRLLMPYELGEITEGGKQMSIKDFKAMISSGRIRLNDSSGQGYYVKNGKESNIRILPSDVKRNMLRNDFDAIVWYSESKCNIFKNL